MDQRLHGGDRRFFSIPIVNHKREIVGWTKASPEYVGLTLRHPEAEHLVGEPICVYVAIYNPDDAARAGAPPGWQGPWRCLALCSAKMRPRDEVDLVAVASVRGRRPSPLSL